MTIKKLARELRFSDYLDHPIWTAYDDGSDYEITVDYPSWTVGSENKKPETEAVTILGEALCADETEFPCIICFSTYRAEAYYLEIYKSEHDSFGFPVAKPLEGKVTREQLANYLGKQVNEVFPLRYTSPFIFWNGKRIEGVYK